MARLKKGDISLREMFAISRQYYKKVDNKIWRMKMDIVSAKVTARNNFVYDRSTKKWEQTGRELKLVFLVKSDPQSYKRTDTLKIHAYPVTFLIRDVSMGIDSAFRWRTGSFAMPKFSKKGDSPQKRNAIDERNIRKGIQLDFFFKLEAILQAYGLLFGPCRAKGLPNIANPSYTPYFDKHALYVFTKLLVPILTKGQGAILGRVFKN